MTTRYAEKTTVGSGASRDEIERTLRRYGATGFMYGWDETRAVLGFVIHGRQVRLVLPMPDANARRFTHTPERGTLRSSEAQAKEYEQAVRQSWRALALVVKAKLEAVEAGVVSFEDEWMPHFVLPDGQTVADHVRDKVTAAYETGTVPSLLPSYDGGTLALTSGGTTDGS